MVSEARDRSQNAEPADQPVSIVIPCKAEYLGLCRVLAGVVGARGSMDTEDVADLKLVVTEACTCFLPAAQDDLPHGSAKDEGEAPASLRVDFRVSPGSWEVTVSDAENRHAISEESACSPWATGGLGLTIMRALVDRVEHTQSESGGSVIRLSKRTDGQVRDLS